MSLSQAVSTRGRACTLRALPLCPKPMAWLKPLSLTSSIHCTGFCPLTCTPVLPVRASRSRQLRREGEAGAPHIVYITSIMRAKWTVSKQG